MAKDRHSTKPREDSLLRRTITQFFSSLNKGIRSLATPKGILATVPLIISLIAFLKASYVTTNLFVLFIEPVTMEVNVTNNNIGQSHVADFEMFLISEGRDTVYTTGINLNIAIFDKTGTFNENCDYLIPDPKTQSTGVSSPYRLSAKPLSKDYAYQLHSGFVVSPNTVLPMSAHLEFASDKLSDDRISTAIGGTKATGYDERVMQIMFNGKPERPEIAFCISGTAFTSDGSRRKFFYHDDSMTGGVRLSYENRNLASPPIAPGGTAVPPMQVQRLVIRGPSFDHAIKIFTARKLTFF